MFKYPIYIYNVLALTLWFGSSLIMFVQTFHLPPTYTGYRIVNAQRYDTQELYVIRLMQMATNNVFTMKNGKQVVYFLNIINLLSSQAWSWPMTSFKRQNVYMKKNVIFEFMLLRTLI